MDQGSSSDPYHEYFFMILKGQGRAAPLGEMDFVLNGGNDRRLCPGCCAVYNVTGVRSFIVSHDGVVYEKDVGPNTLGEFQKMERFDPDKSWTPVREIPESSTTTGDW